MRLVLFTDTLGDVNGVARFLTGLADHALAAGHDLTIITSTRVAFTSRANVVNIPPRMAMTMPGYRDLQVVWPDFGAMRRLVEGIAPDAVHVSTPGPIGLAGRGIARRLGLPLVGTYHTNFPQYVRALLDDGAIEWATGAGLRWFYRPFARLLARSVGSAAALEREGWRISARDAIQPGVDTERFNPSRRDTSIWFDVTRRANFGVKVLCLGRVSREKNLGLLADLWPTVRRRAARAGVPATLVFVGDGPMREELRERLPERNVIFTGVRHGDELATLIASSDLLVFPSTTDTLGQAVLESLASGVPAVVSDIGGPASVVRHGETGLVVPARDAGQWVEAIETLIVDAPLRATMCAAAAAEWATHTPANSYEHFWRLNAEAVGRAPVQKQQRSTPSMALTVACPQKM